MGLLVSSLFKVSQWFVCYLFFFVCFHFKSLDISNIIFLPITILNCVIQYFPTTSLLKVVIEV